MDNYTTLIYSETTGSAVPANLGARIIGSNLVPVLSPLTGITSSSIITGLTGGTYAQDQVLGTGNLVLPVSRWQGGSVAITHVKVTINPQGTTPGMLGVYFFKSAHPAIADKALKTTGFATSISNLILGRVLLDISDRVGPDTIWSSPCNLELNTLSSSVNVNALIYAETSNVLQAVSTGSIEVFSRHV